MLSLIVIGIYAPQVGKKEEAKKLYEELKNKTKKKVEYKDRNTLVPNK